LKLSAETTSKPTAGLIVERHGPSAGAALTLGALILFAPAIAPNFVADGWSTSDLYTAIFSWASIQAGFVFGVYGFVVGKTEGFVADVRETSAMRRFLAYVRRANFGCFFLAVTSLPLVITNPAVSDPKSWSYSLVSTWFALFVWNFFSFLRVSFGFGHLASVPDQKPFHGA
jgi:hypothetical protein